MDMLFRRSGWEPVSISEMQWQQLPTCREQRAWLFNKLLMYKL